MVRTIWGKFKMLPARGRGWIEFLIKLSAAGLLFWLIFIRIEPASIFSRLVSVSLVTVVAMAALMVLQTGVAILRWRIVVDSLGHDIDWRVATRCVLIERFVNQAMPATVGGDAGRILDLVRSDVPMKQAILAVVTDRGFGLWGTTTAIALTLPFSLPIVGGGSAGYSLAIIGIAPIVAMLTIPLVPDGFWHVVLGWHGRLQKVLHLLLRARRVLFDLRFVGYGLGLSVAIQLLIVALYAAIGAGIGVYLPATVWIALVPIVTLATLVPLSIAGWGAREGAMMVLFGLAGVGHADAVSVSILVGLAYLGAGAIGGGFWLMLRQRSAEKQNEEKKTEEMGGALT